MSEKTLADFKEEISDDFQSTFTIVSKHVLVNCMFEHEHETVTKIIHKYLPNAEVDFMKVTDLVVDGYGIWGVKAIVFEEGEK